MLNPIGSADLVEVDPGVSVDRERAGNLGGMARLDAAGARAPCTRTTLGVLHRACRSDAGLVLCGTRDRARR